MRSAFVSARLPVPERAAATATRMRWLSLGALAVLAAASALMAAGLAAAPSSAVTSSSVGFPGWLAGPLHAIDGPDLSEAGFGALLLVMTGAYLAVIALARIGGIPRRWALVAIVGLNLLFLLAPPTTTDLFGYLGYARLPLLHDLNPYTHGAGGLIGDPVHHWLIWHDDPSPYGPLFTLGSFAFVPLGVAAGMWGLKVVGALCALGVVLLCGRAARTLGRDPVGVMLFVGLNPLLLVYTVAGAHNDAEMMLLAVGALVLVLERRDALAGAAGVAAVAIKATVAPPLLFLTPLARGRRRVLLGALAALVVVALASLIALGPGVVHAAGALASQGGNVSPRAPLTMVAGWFGVTSDGALHALAAVLLVAGLAAVLVRAWRGGDPVSNAAWAAIVLLVASTWLMPWYAIMFLPFAALAPALAPRLAALAVFGFVVGTHVHLG
jgi:hypothetical protein